MKGPAESGQIRSVGRRKIYPYALRTRKSAGLMTRKLSVTELQKVLSARRARAGDARRRPPPRPARAGRVGARRGGRRDRVRPRPARAGGRRRRSGHGAGRLRRARRRPGDRRRARALARRGDRLLRPRARGRAAPRAQLAGGEQEAACGSGATGEELKPRRGGRRPAPNGGDEGESLRCSATGSLRATVRCNSWFHLRCTSRCRSSGY